MVYLVGAGPGDPGLITVKGLALLRRADVVVYDQLANPELLKEVPAGAEILYVGKKAGDHAVPQGGINELLVAKSPGRAHGGAPQGRRPLCLWPGRRGSGRVGRGRHPL